MATHPDYVIANASGAAVRDDLNKALAAIVSNNSSATDPATSTTTYPHQWWYDTTAGQLKLRNAADDDWVVVPVLDSSGRLLIGTTTARANFYNSTVSAAVQIEGTEIDDRVFSMVSSSSTTTAGPRLTLGHQLSGTIGGNTIVGSDTDLGSLVFQGSDGSEFVRAAQIVAYTDGTPGADDMPGRLAFYTTADGSSSPAERMRITSGGIVGIGNLGATNTGSAQSGVPASFWLSATATTSNPPAEFYGNTTTTRHHVAFSNGNGVVGSISTNGTATAYNTSSDYRLKENVTPVTDGITRLQQLKPSRFNFIADPDTTVDGFIAHEAQAVVPECVTGTHDEVEVWSEGEELPDGVSVGDNKLDEAGNTIPIYQGIDQSKLVPLLTAALQEAIAKIETLEAKVAALEAAN
jgi:hypothetical protein